MGEFLESLGAGRGVGGLEGGRVLSIKVRLPTEVEPSVLLVVRATSAAGPRIMFVGAYDLGDAILAWRARSVAEGIKWRIDVSYEEWLAKRDAVIESS